MTNKISTRKLYIPVLLFFVFINAVLIGMKKPLLNLGIDQAVAISGNLVLFIATLLSLFLYQRAMVHASTHGFLRNAYSGLIAKLVICLVSVGIYAMAERQNVNKQGIFACVFFYFIYSIIEMRSLMRWNKERTNA
jgi:CDP-diglyceride synthetase